MLNSSVIRCYVTKSTGINLGQVTSDGLVSGVYPWLSPTDPDWEKLDAAS